MWDWHDIPWSEFFSNQTSENKIPESGIDLESIKAMCKVLSTPPQGITVHNAVRNRERAIFFSMVRIFNVLNEYPVGTRTGVKDDEETR